MMDGRCLCALGCFVAVVIWNSRAGKEAVVNFPQPGRAARF